MVLLDWNEWTGVLTRTTIYWASNKHVHAKSLVGGGAGGLKYHLPEKVLFLQNNFGTYWDFRKKFNPPLKFS